MVGSLIPQAAASSRVVVPRKPRSENSLMAARMMDSRRSVAVRRELGGIERN